MPDIYNKKQRSRNMAAIRGRYNKSTEIAVARLFRCVGISGWRRHYQRLPGTPDFVFLNRKTAIFVDGCFWHGCSKCKNYPQTNRQFWMKKITDNKRRDKRVNKELILIGWKVLRFWEHEIKKHPDKILSKIILQNLVN